MFRFKSGHHPALKKGRYDDVRWFATESGIAPLEKSIIAGTDRRIVIFATPDVPVRWMDCGEQRFLFCRYRESSKGKGVTRSWLRQATAADPPDYLPVRPDAAQVLLGKRWSADTSFFDGVPKFVQNNLHKIQDFPNATLYCSDPNNTRFSFDLARLISSDPQGIPNDVRIAEWSLPVSELNDNRSRFAKAWHQFVPDAIPIDPTARKHMRDSVYDQLAQFIDWWEWKVANG